MGIAPFFAALRRCFDYSGTMSRADFGCFLGWLMLLTICWRLITDSWMPVLLLALPPLVSAMVRRSRDARPEEVGVMLLLMATPLVFAFLYAVVVALGEWITGGTWPDLLFQIPVAIVAVAFWGLILLELLIRENAEERARARFATTVPYGKTASERAASQALITVLSDQIAERLGLALDQTVTSKRSLEGDAIRPIFDLIRNLCTKHRNGMSGQDYEAAADQMRVALLSGGWTAAKAEITARVPERFEGALSDFFPQNRLGAATPKELTALVHARHPEALAVIAHKRGRPCSSLTLLLLLPDDLAEAAMQRGVDAAFYRAYPGTFSVRREELGLAINAAGGLGAHDYWANSLTIRKLSRAGQQRAPESAAGYVDLDFQENRF